MERSSLNSSGLISPSLMASLPEEVFVHIIARVPRCYYPTLSLVSRRFRSVITSSELYARRSLLNCTEHFLYSLIYNTNTSLYHWYILHRKHNKSLFALIPSLPPMFFPSPRIFVTVGSRIHVVSECYNHILTSRTLSIDCRFHTVRPIPSLPMTMVGTVTNIVDKKIYVIGKCDSNDPEMRNSTRVMVFDTETQMWEPEIRKPDMELGYLAPDCVVMENKIYMKGTNNSFVYEPMENKWEMEETLNYTDWTNAYVIEDMLYYYDHGKNKLRTYDPKHRCWGVVKGVERLLPGVSSWWSQTVSYGRKLVVFLPKSEGSKATIEIFCVGVSLERRQRGEIWGKVEWCDVVLDGRVSLLKSVAVMV